MRSFVLPIYGKPSYIQNCAKKRKYIKLTQKVLLILTLIFLIHSTISASYFSRNSASNSRFSALIDFIVGLDSSIMLDGELTSQTREYLEEKLLDSVLILTVIYMTSQLLRLLKLRTFFFPIPD